MAQRASISRSSKFRHIYGEKPKLQNEYQDIRSPMTSGESTYVKANGTFFAVGKSAGGGPVYIRKLDEPGRFKAGYPMLSVQKGKLTDLDFNPFIENMIATAGDDCRINVTLFPKQGLIENITQPTVSIAGHSKKISLIQFHPTTKSIIASGSFDKTIKIFNIESQSMVCEYDKINDNIYSLEWNKNGSLLAITSKEKTLDSKGSVIKVSCFDPRNSTDSAISFDAFDGIKSSKCFWVPSFNWIGCVGFNKSAHRMLKLWDTRNYEKPIYSQKLDQQSSILCPNMDFDLNVLYLAGKGDSTISYWELVNDDKLVYNLSAYRDTQPQKGGGWVQKRGLNVWKCEVQRFLKLTKTSIQPISFIVPRKSGQDVFQDDIYPNCYSGKPALKPDEWLNGTNKDPITMSMNPDDRKKDENENENEEEFVILNNNNNNNNNNNDDNNNNDSNQQLVNDDSNEFKEAPKLSYDKLEKENKSLKNKVIELENTIKELNERIIELENNNNNNNNNDNNNSNDIITPKNDENEPTNEESNE